MLPRRRSRVLLLDDDPALRRLVSLLLERAGHRVDTVTKGNDAIAAIGKARYAAILLDIMMPHEGGMTVIRHLREHDPALLGRVLLLTGAPPSALKSVASEVAGIVYKPFDAKELIAAVERVTSQSKA